MTRRERQWSEFVASRRVQHPAPASEDISVYPFVSSQRTWSQGHRFHGSYVPGDSGGPFESQRTYYKRVDHLDVVYKYFTDTYRSRITAVPPSTPSYITSPVSETTLLARGTTAIAQTRPTAPLAGLGVTIGELREGLPKIVGSGLMKTRISDLRKIPKRGSDEYLNWEFGWKPLIKDVRDSCNAVRRHHKIIDQLVRDDGRLVRRKFGFPREVTTSVTSTTGYGYPSLPAAAYSGIGTLRTTTETRSDVWFRGAFRYHLPKGKDMLSQSRLFLTEANRLLGLRPDPELLWNLAPWTWLTDWFANTGDLMANLSSMAFDGLVLDYGYVMNHYQEITKYHLSGLTIASRPANLTCVRVKEHKRRLRATPFGFGLELPDFTNWQLSILAALGISRVHTN